MFDFTMSMKKGNTKDIKNRVAYSLYQSEDKQNELTNIKRT